MEIVSKVIHIAPFIAAKNSLGYFCRDSSLLVYPASAMVPWTQNPCQFDVDTFSVNGVIFSLRDTVYVLIVQNYNRP